MSNVQCVCILYRMSCPCRLNYYTADMGAVFGIGSNSTFASNCQTLIPAKMTQQKNMQPHVS